MVSIYDNYKISNAAFMCDTKNLNLVSIIALLLDSWDDAIELIDRIIINTQPTMYKFAIYLATKRIMLVNQNNNSRELYKFFKTYTNHKVLFVGDKPEVNYHSLVKKQIWIQHCSG